MRKHKEEHTPGETQDITDARITLQLQQDAMDVQEGAEGTEHGDNRVVQALLLALLIVAHMLNQPQEVGIESPEGKDASNPEADQPHSLKEYNYTIYSIVLSATL